jgi:Flp pilus assembly protein TadD
VIELEPLHSKAYSLRGEAFFKLGRLLDARADLESALKLSPEDDELREDLNALNEQIRL